MGKKRWKRPWPPIPRQALGSHEARPPGRSPGQAVAFPSAGPWPPTQPVRSSPSHAPPFAAYYLYSRFIFTFIHVLYSRFTFHCPASSVGVQWGRGGGGSSVGSGVSVSSGGGGGGATVAVTVSVGGTGGVTVGGPCTTVAVTKRVGVTNGVNVGVAVFVGSGVPGVMVGVGEWVGVMVGISPERSRVGPGRGVPSCSTTTRPNAVAVGRPRGAVGLGVRSHETNSTNGAATITMNKTNLQMSEKPKLNKRKRGRIITQKL